MADALPRQTEAVPGIFLEVAHAYVKLDRTHKLDAVVAGAIELLCDGQHHCRGHARGPKALLTIPHRGVYDLDALHAVLWRCAMSTLCRSITIPDLLR